MNDLRNDALKEIFKQLTVNKLTKKAATDPTNKTVFLPKAGFFFLRFVITTVMW